MWSFGVTVWEIMEYGVLPYPGVSNTEVQRKIREGLRLTQPRDCPDNLFEVLTKCWHESPENRWRFSEILDVLQEFMDEVWGRGKGKWG